MPSNQQCEKTNGASPGTSQPWQRRSTVSSDSGEHQRPFRFAQTESHSKVLPIVKDHDVFAFEHRQQFLDLVEVHDGAAADAQKFLRVELRLQLAQRLAKDMTFLPEL